MTRRATILLAALIALYGAPAAAQIACGTRDIVVEKLDRKYGETRRGGGLSGPTMVFEIWASDKPPYTWTILKTAPNGWACIMAVGEGWQPDPPVAPGELL